jgi:hypothetical protein
MLILSAFLRKLRKNGSQLGRFNFRHLFGMRQPSPGPSPSVLLDDLQGQGTAPARRSCGAREAGVYG